MRRRKRRKGVTERNWFFIVGLVLVGLLIIQILWHHTMQRADEVGAAADAAIARSEASLNRYYSDWR